MFRKLLFLLVIVFSLAYIAPRANAADEPQCLCVDDISVLTPENFLTKAEEVKDSGCQPLPANASEPCEDLIKKPDGSKYAKCFPSPSLTACQGAMESWKAEKAEKANRKAAPNSPASSGGEFGGFLNSSIPKCLMQDDFGRTNPCRDIGVFIHLFINWGRGSFAIVGSFALAYFIYGGFILIMSQGNPEQIKKGTDTMLAALIGLFVMFAGYMLIRFLGQAVGVRPEFRLR